MKRFFSILLPLLFYTFLLCGCIQENTSEIPAYTPNIKTPETSTSNQPLADRESYDLFLYEGRAFFTAPGRIEGLCSLAPGETEPTCLLKDANLYGIYGSLLLCRTSDGFHAKDLKKQENWVDLKAIPKDADGSAVLNGNTLLFFGHTDTENFIVRFDCTTLQSSYQKIDTYIHREFVEDGSIFVLAIDIEQGKTIIYRSDEQVRDWELLCQTNKIYNEFHKSNNRIVLYDHTESPMVYDLDSKKFFHLTFKGNVERAGDLFYTVATDHPEVYDSSTNQYLPKERFNLTEHSLNLENGQINPPQRIGDPWEFRLTDYTHTVQGIEIPPAYIKTHKANQHIGALLFMEDIVLIDWETKEITRLNFR